MCRNSTNEALCSRCFRENKPRGKVYRFLEISSPLVDLFPERLYFLKSPRAWITFPRARSTRLDSSPRTCEITRFSSLAFTPWLLISQLAIFDSSFRAVPLSLSLSLCRKSRISHTAERPSIWLMEDPLIHRDGKGRLLINRGNNAVWKDGYFYGQVCSMLK